MSPPHDELERLRLLYQVSNVIHSTVDSQEALQLILQGAIRLTQATSGSVVLINPTNNLLEIQAAFNLPHDAKDLRLQVGAGITGWVAQTGKPARIGNVREDSRYVVLRDNVQSELAVPLEVRGQVRGVLNVDSERRDAFTERDQELLEALAGQAATVIQHTWLYDQLRLRAQMFESLIKVGQTINSAVNLDDALLAITREACRLMRGRMCSLMLLDPTGEWLDLRAHHGAGQAYLQKPRLSVSDSLLGTVVRRKKFLQEDNVQTSTRYQNVEIAREEGLLALLSMPLLYQGQALGTLNVYKGETYIFSNEEIHTLSALAELSALAIEKARLYERVVDMEELLRQNEKLSALGLLAAEVAHEIRNPLTVMKMLYHSLDLQFPPDDPRARDVAVMGEKMDLLNKIVEQILDYARTSEPTLAPVNLNDLVTDLGLLIRHKFKNQNIELVRELEPGLPSISGDRVQLEQAFLNLTLNAVEAMPHGGKLTIATRGRPGEVEILFRDTGHGLSDEQRENAFGSLLRTTKPKGTGLGLAIVKRVVDVHRGRVTITSTAGNGAEICLIFPDAANA